MTDQTAETTVPDAPETAAEDTTKTADTDQATEVDWKAKARDWEKRSKDNLAKLKALEPKAAEYDRLEAASKTDAERAQEALKAANERAAAMLQRAARSEVKAALAGIVDDPDAIVDDLNLARFVNDDGDVDADAVKQLRAKYAKFSSPRPPRPDPSQASGANGKTGLTPQEEFGSILQAAIHKSGR